jgi:hypothetical protein
MLTAISIDLDDPDRPRDGRGRKPFGGSSEGNKSNILQRTWARSVPVLHLAIALEHTIDEAGIPDPDFGFILFDDALCKLAYDSAAIIKPLVAKVFGIERQF